MINMFNKKKCPKCRGKIEEKFGFCPYCGNRVDFEEDIGENGLLGKNDFTPIENAIKLPLGFNTLFNSLMKNLSREFEEQMNGNFADESKAKKVKKDGISISISTFGNGPPKIRINNAGSNKKTEEKIVEKLKKDTFTQERIKKFSSLKKEEPKTNIRRLSDKVVYEIEMPEVESIDDVSIIKLENSIEIKAIGSKKAYSKRIPINLPIRDYNLSEGKLILELGVKN
ncbi:Uncharacterised protein [uncultured archaeon]|nr:Uncharacterised protein [uncultured archaeon]